MSYYFIDDFIYKWSRERINEGYSVKPSEVDTYSKFLGVMLFRLDDHRTSPFKLVDGINDACFNQHVIDFLLNYVLVLVG